jgi:hypothetical protein
MGGKTAKATTTFGLLEGSQNKSRCMTGAEEDSKLALAGWICHV